MAATQDKSLQRKNAPFHKEPFTPASSQTFYKHTMAMFVPASGSVTPVAETTVRTDGLFPSVAGVAANQYVNPTRDIEFDVGTFLFVNGDSIAETDRGKPCYASDNETVVKASASGNLPICGEIKEVDANGVWVRVYTVGEAKLVSASLLA